MKYLLIALPIAVSTLLFFNLTVKKNDSGLSSLKGETSLQPSTGEEASLDTGGISSTTILSGLEVPWELTWGPDNWIWYTEQNGKVSRVNPATGEIKLLLQVPDVYRKRLGLMSMALHPDMKNAPYVYLNYTFKNKDYDPAGQKTDSILSRLVRYTYTGNALTDPLVLLEFPGNTGHNGSRIVIAPDKTLMLITGDVDMNNDDKNGGNAQRINTTGGKVLRLNLDGTIPKDNPFPGNPVWALGFRVPQGLVYASNGKLYSAEHGNDTDDEINLIQKGGNYGYPYVLGACNVPGEMDYCSAHHVIGPIKAWTPTVAPAGLDYYNSSAIPEWKNSLLLATLKTQSLRVLKLNADGTKVIGEKVYFEKIFGRMRDVCVSPTGDVYMSTSNMDWNPPTGFPIAGDDRIIKVFKSKKAGGVVKNATAKTPVKSEPVKKPALSAAATAYNNYCSSCHKEDGKGVPGVFPALKGSAVAIGDKSSLIRKVMLGINPPGHKGEYEQKMSAFTFLSDNQLANVLTYIRKQFGNKAGSITTSEVTKIRNAHK